MNKKILALMLVAGLTTGHASAETKPFVAICKDAKAYGYRYTAGSVPTGNGEWQDWGSFGRPWRFAYSGGDKILIDDKVGIVLFTENAKILFIEMSSNGIAASVWAFALRLDLDKAVATKTNLSTAGLQAVSVELECTMDEAR